MPLTPEDVRNKRFTPVRLREGYDMGEVDQFLDEVESELERLNHENEELRQKLAAAQRGEAPFVKQPVPEQHEPPVHPQVRQPQGGPQSVADASTAAARLLEIATQNADQLVAEAKEQANRILSDARARAERLENEARGLASRLESEARAKAEQLERETNEKRSQLFGQLDKEKARLQREVDELRSYERQYRSRLKAYFESQLRLLAGQGSVENGVGPQPVDASGPRTLNAHKPAAMAAGAEHRSGGGTPRLNALLEDDEESAL
ncbi:MAG TPA: DivIVA domain-containing protein [Actinopolymorphaceae bacterium]|jgi:DivIVA domain-containing protein